MMRSPPTTSRKTIVCRAFSNLRFIRWLNSRRRRLNQFLCHAPHFLLKIRFQFFHTLLSNADINIHYSYSIKNVLLFMWRMCIKLSYQASISSFHIKIWYQEFISRFDIKLSFQAFISSIRYIFERMICFCGILPWNPTTNFHGVISLRQKPALFILL